MARTKTETVVDWCARNGMSVSFAPVADGRYVVTIDRDGADKKLTMDWYDPEAPENDPALVMADVRDNCLAVERVKDDADMVKGRYGMDDPDSEWGPLLNELAAIRKTAQDWLGPVEFAKLMKTEGSEWD